MTSDGQVLGEALSSQADVHAPYGGVVPTLAMEAHKGAIDRVVDEALRKAGLTAEQLDAVAVTVGPGLSMCLKVGVMKARQLAAAHRLPIVPVHHMEAHALVARLASISAAAAAAATAAASEAAQTAGEAQAASAAAPHWQAPLQHGSNGSGAQSGGSASGGNAGAGGDLKVNGRNYSNRFAGLGVLPPLSFPFLCLLVSGGHNVVVLVRGVGMYLQLGTTLDDAIGEATNVLGCGLFFGTASTFSVQQLAFQLCPADGRLLPVLSLFLAFFCFLAFP